MVNREDRLGTLFWFIGWDLLFWFIAKQCFVSLVSLFWIVEKGERYMVDVRKGGRWKKVKWWM